MIRRNADGTIPARISLAEYCELMRLELSRFEQELERRVREIVSSSKFEGEYPFETFDASFEEFRAAVPDEIRHRPAGAPVPADGEA